MAYPRYITKSAFASGNGGITLAALTGLRAGDILVIFVESANQAVSLPVDSAATLEPWLPFTLATGTGPAGSAGGVRLSSFYKIVTEFETDVSTNIADSGDHTTAIKMAFRDTSKL